MMMMNFDCQKQMLSSPSSHYRVIILVLSSHLNSLVKNNRKVWHRYMHLDIPGRLHSAERWATVLEQGTGKIWGGEEPEATTAAAPIVPNEANEPIADFIFNAQNGAVYLQII